jgi:hypothetical protein
MRKLRKIGIYLFSDKFSWTMVILALPIFLFFIKVMVDEFMLCFGMTEDTLGLYIVIYGVVIYSIYTIAMFINIGSIERELKNEVVIPIGGKPKEEVKCYHNKDMVINTGFRTYCINCGKYLEH